MESQTEQHAVVRPHFDARYYRREYPDLATNDASDGDATHGDVAGDEAAIAHFCALGWREGRNPNAGFDVVAYLLANAEVEAAGINPFVHYLLVGQPGRLPAAAAVTPSAATQRLFGTAITDWVERLAPHVDANRYRAAIQACVPLEHRIDPVAHYAFRGWRSGLNPSGHFNTRLWMTRHPAECRAMVNPLLVALQRSRPGGPGEARAVVSPEVAPELAPKVAPGLAQDIAPDLAPSGVPLTAGEIGIVAAEFAERFYRLRHPEAAASGLDAVSHYLTLGWRRGHDPNPDFDTGYYLAANPDVAAAGVNPFLHFLTAGRREGRNPVPPARYTRRFVEQAHEDPHAARPRPPRGARSDAALLEQSSGRLAEGLATPGRGLVLSVSHDVYTRSVGGTQIVISDEQARFNRMGWTYLHVAPCDPGLSIKRASTGGELHATLNGAPVGRLTVGRVLAALGTATPGAGRRVLVIHSMLGFASDDLVGIVRTFRPQRAVYWVHDYSAVCSGFNLLRNNVEFCHAPPLASVSCLVCGHGRSRASQVAAADDVLAAAEFSILAPSRAAADVWAASRDGRRATVHPHWLLRFDPMRPVGERPGNVGERPGNVGARPGDLGARPGDGAVRVAFIGHPFASKGWPAFAFIADQLGADPRYRFLYFGRQAGHLPAGVGFVKTEVRPDDRFASVANLRAARIDLVLVLSPWPETFSFVAHEAIAAGALVLCLACSGNVAALVGQTGRGKVFGDADDLLAFLRSPDLGRWIDACVGGALLITVEEVGTTATAFDFTGTADSDTGLPDANTLESGA